MSSSGVPIDVTALLAALRFAADKHKNQSRKKDAGPYINHPIAVAELLARVAGVAELEVLQTAFLHDVLEDTPTPPEEVERLFGAKVRSLVEEVTDDMSLPHTERKRLQQTTARRLSLDARLIRIADKICNISDMTREQPSDWSGDRKLAYLDWAELVVAECRGSNRPLEDCFESVLAEKRALLAPGV